MKKYIIKFTKCKEESKIFSVLIIPNYVYFLTDMKSFVGKSFRSFLFYSNLKYIKFHESYMTHAVLNLLNFIVKVIILFLKS